MTEEAQSTVQTVAPSQPISGTNRTLPSGNIASDVLVVGEDVVQAAKGFVDQVEAKAKAVFQPVEPDALAVIGNLGHVRKVLDGFSFSSELGAAKDYVNQAIIAIAQHIGG